MADHYDEQGNLLVNTAGSLPILASAVGSKVSTAHSPTNYAGTFEDTVGVNAAFGRKSAGGWIANDGPGNLLIGLSADGAATGITTDGSTSTVLVLAAGETVDLPAGIHTMKIDADQNNTAYRFEVV
ncbi:MAG: hypothetical protein M1455_06480 [Actinobacteria bacterium]|nr:hypothetical protein [Actinomycetota bacterium]